MQTQLETQCETIWISLSLHRAKTLYIGCYYRPNAQDNTSCAALGESLSRIPIHSNIIIAGDFNYPDMDWQTKTVTAHTNRRMHEEFIDFIYDYSLKQLVDTPTRQGNILDLILTNASEHCNECTTIPGISDHEAVIARFTFCPIRHKQLARNIPLYRKADWPSFNNHMLEFHARIIGGGAPTLEVNQLWAEFKQAIHNGISKYIPHKLAKSTNRKPWVSRETVRLLRQRNRAYTKQKSGLQEDLDRYKYLKSKAQRQLRNDYWTYLEDIVTPDSNGDTHTANKRFWSFIKHTRQDMTGIPNLIDDNGMEYTTQLTKAHALNQQFSSVF